MIEFNVNEKVRFKPTPEMKRIFVKKKTYKSFDGVEVNISLNEDENGYCEMQLWEFMNIFGECYKHEMPSEMQMNLEFDTKVKEIKLEKEKTIFVRKNGCIGKLRIGDVELSGMQSIEVIETPGELKIIKLMYMTEKVENKTEQERIDELCKQERERLEKICGKDSDYQSELIKILTEEILSLREHLGYD